MRALQVMGPGAVEVVEVPAPRPAPGEALLRVRYAGICGSDIQTLRGTQPFASYPRVPGHEFSAEIVELGDSDHGPDDAPGATGDFAVGDLVTGVPYFEDGTCYSCRRGLVNACVHNETMGVHRDGAFQELLTMPLDRLHRAEGIDPRDLALVEPFSIGYHAVRRAAVGPGDRVLVLGAGAIGLLTLLAARLHGAEVWIADVVPGRLELAASLGAAGTADLTTATIPELVGAATGGDGFDVVCEATGVPVSFTNAIEAAAVGARLALIGNGTAEVTFQQSVLIKKELTVVGSRNSRGVFPALIELLETGQVDVAPLRTSVVPFTAAAGALQAAAAGSTADVKVLLEFPPGP
ncbi:zinc-binding alcohol dehydrogenase family protein [Brachybacterium fresconis]|uniref:Threonine dehydrogenase-like Zn-dependent dehydrogenase n=1 Tax=Brachybacterium fresconis TaxID=173363 RepID=A0ABS4YNW0_9MICO|nr:zinc-binding alcohol dehydrogenase family protein [Brachybacterium fresconis]MBP2410482.1 threonine dehydrogenase-like Zn-dependent dehydrogenase [Brachybacterium fresconis]